MELQEETMNKMNNSNNSSSNNSINSSNDDDFDYLQVLDAGEHMYGMFVGENEDLYAYLRSSNDEQQDYEYDCNYNIDEILSRSVDSLFLGSAGGVDVTNETRCNDEDDCNSSDDERSATTGRVTPTKAIEEGHHDDDVMIE